MKLSDVYIPSLGTKWGKCIDHQPTFGQYGITDDDIVAKQIELMHSFGITTVPFNFGEGPPTFDRYRAFRQAANVDEITVEVFWAINRIFQRDLELDRYLDFIREEMFTDDTYATIEGRHVVQFWGSNYIPWDEQTKQEVREEYGGLAEFVGYLRERLTVDGTEPLGPTSASVSPGRTFRETSRRTGSGSGV